MTISRAGHLAWILVLVGCTRTAPPAPVGEHMEKKVGTDGLVTFLADDKGTITSEGDRPKFTWGRKFKIEGKLDADAAVGDSVFVDLLIRAGSDKWSTAANAIGKVQAVENGKAQFRANFFITEMKEQDCRLRITHYSAKKDQRSDLATVDVHVSAPH